MTTTVTKESLAARIADLEYGPRSLKEDYTLAAYKMLLATMDAEPDIDYSALRYENAEPCAVCGKVSSHPEGWHYCHGKK